MVFGQIWQRNLVREYVVHLGGQSDSLSEHIMM